MARARKITRTIKTTKVVALCINIAEEKPYKQEVTLSGVFKDDQSLLKAVKAAVDSDTVKAVHIEGPYVVEALYAMDEQKFIELAEIVPAKANENK